MILGSVLAGNPPGTAGSDLALEEVGGHTRLALAVDMLSGWCEYVIVTGRPTAPAPTLPGWPRGGSGHLEGLAAALRHAVDEGYEAVLSCGLDIDALPEALPDLLTPGPACLGAKPEIGLWPTSVLPALEEWLHEPSHHTIATFVDRVGGRRV